MVKWICQILLLVAVMAFLVSPSTALGASKKKSAPSQISSKSLRISGEADFFKTLNLELPGMRAVKRAVKARDWLAAKKALLAHMRSRKKPRFFVDRHRKDEYIAFAKSNLSQAVKNLPAKANNACNHDFTFGGINHRFDGPIIWDRTKSGMSFVYNCWLNRMWYLETLGQAWWFTGDKKYARGARELVDSWIKSCPMPPKVRRHWHRRKPQVAMSVNGNPWGQSLEVAERLGSWTAFNEYFVDSPEISPEFYYRFLVSLLEQSRYIYIIESKGYASGNWAIVECSGLARVTIMFPEFKESANWWKQLKKLFAMQAKKTILPDGVQMERCIGYHNWCYRKFRDVLLLGRLNEISLPTGFARTVELMRLYPEKISYPGKSRRPALGDGSGVSWWRKSKKTPVKKAEKSSQPGSVRLLWQLGLDAFKEYNNSRVVTPHYTSTELPYGGLFVMRTGWEPREDMFLLFDCVPRSKSGGHWHHSALNVDIYAFGRPLIVDAGMSGYSRPGHTDYYRRVRAHNIIEFAGGENSQDPKLKRWLRSESFDLAEGAVRAGWRAKMHRRILFVRGDYWIIDDNVSVPHTHPTVTRAYWHLNSRSVVVGGKQAELATDGDGASRLRWMGEKGKDLSFYTNDSDIGNILVIPDGGEKYVSLSLIADTPCGGHVACYRQDPNPPKKTKLRFSTLLYPFKGTKRPAVSFKNGVVKIGPDRADIYLRKGKKTDGDCALVSRQKDTVQRVLLASGSYIKGVVRTDSKVDFLIITRNGKSIDVKIIAAAKVNRIELPGFEGIKKVTVNGKAQTLRSGIVKGPFKKIKPDPKNTKLFWIIR